MLNTLGNLLSLTTFGESHGLAYGGIINNFPAGLTVDFDKVQYELDRRKPGQSAIVTQRKESDTVKFLSGIFDGKTTGTPIGFIIENELGGPALEVNPGSDACRASNNDL